MALESHYDWNSAPPGARSWIKPWMVIALILSGGVHAGLYVWFQQVVVPREASPTRSAIESLKDLKVQQVINESAKPREPESTRRTRLQLLRSNPRTSSSRLKTPTNCRRNCRMWKFGSSRVRIYPDPRQRRSQGTCRRRSHTRAGLRQTCQGTRSHHQAHARQGSRLITGSAGN